MLLGDTLHVIVYETHSREKYSIPNVAFSPLYIPVLLISNATGCTKGQATFTYLKARGEKKPMKS